MSSQGGSRRKSRRKAFELLFELEQHTGLSSALILERTFADPDLTGLYDDDEDEDGYVTGPLDKGSEQFIRELVENAKEYEVQIDAELSKYPHDWSYDRIGTAERILLRLALTEMLCLGTSYKVVINETLDLSKQYAPEDARRFINGILGAVVNDLEATRARVLNRNADSPAAADGSQKSEGDQP